LTTGIAASNQQTLCRHAAACLPAGEHMSESDSRAIDRVFYTVSADRPSLIGRFCCRRTRRYSIALSAAAAAAAAADKTTKSRRHV